jgi:glycine cleavage system regulatory protein
MDAPLVITVVAKDRPGLVEALASAVSENGGNWLESRMSRLGGQFAGILRVAIPSAERDKLAAALQSLQAGGLKLIVQEDEARPGTLARGGRFAELTLVGQDRPGIVRQISQAFARGNVNVEELETECSSAPMSGEMLFHARARVYIPGDCDLAALRAELEKVAVDLMVDVKLTELPSS